MAHDHAHSGPARRGGRRLSQALAITAGVFVVELVGGFWTNSLALLADAGHMLTDVAALSLALVALRISARQPTHRKTYGYMRVEILAALANGVFLVLVALYVFYEAYTRLHAPEPVRGGAMLAVAAGGLVANLATAGLLYRSHRESLNIRGAFLHVLGDALGSVGGIAAGVAILGWQWYLADPIVSMAVAVLVLYSSWQLLRDSVDVLLEGTPAHLDIGAILADLGSVRGVVSVHDLHVWSITSGLTALSCHVVVRPGEDSAEVLGASSRLMRERHGIEHTTIQIEAERWVVLDVGPGPDSGR